MNEKLKQELAELEGEIQEHQMINNKKRNMYGSQTSIRSGPRWQMITWTVVYHLTYLKWYLREKGTFVRIIVTCDEGLYINNAIMCFDHVRNRWNWLFKPYFSIWSTLYMYFVFIFIIPPLRVTEGDITIGSVCPSVCPSVTFFGL